MERVVVVYTLEQNKLMQQTRGKHSMFWWCASTKQGKRAKQNARVFALWFIYALESATRFDRVGVLSSQAAQRRERERFVCSLADDEGFCLMHKTPHGAQRSWTHLYCVFCFVFVFVFLLLFFAYVVGKNPKNPTLSRPCRTCSDSHRGVTIWWPIYISRGFSAQPFNVK